MSSLPYSTPFSQHSHAWADKPAAASTLLNSAVAYPFPFPPAAPSFTRPSPAPAYHAPLSDADTSSSRGPLLLPAPPVPQLHMSPSPAVLAEVLQPAFRRSQPLSSSGCSESQVCDLLSTALQHGDKVRAQADAQKDAAIGQWMQRCLDDAQRRLDSRLERVNHERQEQGKQHASLISALQERLAAVESGMERLSQRLTQTEIEKHCASWPSNGGVRQSTDGSELVAASEDTAPPPVPTQQVVPVASSQSLNSQQDEEQEEDEDEDEKESTTDEEELEAETEQEAAAAELTEHLVQEGNQLDTTAASAPQSRFVQPASPRHSRTSTSPVPWSSPSQPTPAKQYSRRSTAQADTKDAPLSPPTIQPLPAASSSLLALSQSATSQPSAECGLRRKARCRDEAAMLREAAGMVDVPSQSTTAYEFPASG